MNLIFDLELVHVETEWVGNNLFEQLEGGPDGRTRPQS